MCRSGSVGKICQRLDAKASQLRIGSFELGVLRVGDLARRFRVFDEFESLIGRGTSRKCTEVVDAGLRQRRGQNAVGFILKQAVECPLHRGAFREFRQRGVAQVF